MFGEGIGSTASIETFTSSKDEKQASSRARPTTSLITILR